MPRSYPTIQPGLLLPEDAAALNDALADLGTLMVGVRTVPPMYCIQDGGGVVIGLDLQSDAAMMSVPAGTTVTNYGTVIYASGSTIIFSGVVLNVTADLNVNVSTGVTYFFNGPGYYDFTGPVAICGYQFWCCYAYTFVSATVSNWSLPAAATVYDVIANAGGTILTGIKPTAFGRKINTGDITAATNASPIVLTVPGWTTMPIAGQVVTVAGVLGNTGANGTWTVQAASATTLTLQNSAGSGGFAVSAGSTVQFAGDQLIVLHNVGADAITISALSASSDPGNQIALPPAYGSSLVLAEDDVVGLWWDGCSTYQWAVLWCTVATPATIAAYSASNTSYSITGSYANVTGLSISIPAGTYQIVVDGGFQWNPSAGAQTITVRLYDGTAAIGNTDPTIIDSVDMTPLGGTQYGTFSVRSFYTAAGTVTITLQAKVSAGGLTPAIINSNLFILKTG